MTGVHGRLSRRCGPQSSGVAACLAVVLVALVGCGGVAHAAPTWQADFETGDFSEWTWHRQSNGGTYYVADATAEGVPPAGANKLARFEVTAAQAQVGKVHAKLYKEWALSAPETNWRDDAGRRLERLPNDSPSGTYVAHYFFPSGYRATIGNWVNIFQWKESYLGPGGDWHQDPQWWINVNAARAWPHSPVNGVASRPDAPVLFANHWRNNHARSPKLYVVPLGRWFELRAELYSGDRIDWYIDDEFFDRSSASDYPIGLSKERQAGWVFGVGHYGGASDRANHLWVDDVSFTAR